MSPSPTSDPAPHRATVRARRWRRIRARAQLWRRRMHSHPVLLWTWRTLVVLVGGLLLMAGLVMWFTPGPGWGAVLLGLAVLATEFGWARGLLSRGRVFVRYLEAKAKDRHRARRERKTAQQRTSEESG